MKNHLVIKVKEQDMSEFITKLDSKGWSVMDIEPTTRINFISLGIGLIGIIIFAIYSFGFIPKEVAMTIAGIFGIAFLSTLGCSYVTTYTVVCEYVGNDQYIDITPFDDTDDAFIKNGNYDEENPDSETDSENEPENTDDK